MRDDKGMSVYEEVCKSLFGDAVDSRELFAKFNPDSSDVHVPRVIGKQKPRVNAVPVKQTADRRQRAITAGLSATGAAAGVGGLALAGAKYRKAYKIARAAGSAAKPALKIAAHEEKGAALLLPLEAAGLGGEVMATKILHHDVSSKKPHIFAKADFEPILTARRMGVITTEQALDLIDKAAKVPFGAATGLKKLTAGIKQEKAAGTYASNIIASGMKSVGTPMLHKLGYAGAATGGLAAGALGHKLLGGGKNNPKMPKTAPMQLPAVNVSAVSVKKSITWEGDISKINEEKHQVFGWATVTEVDGVPVVDRQNDLVTLEEIEKAAYDYVISSRVGGDQHRRDGAEPFKAADLIESFLVTDEKLAQLGIEPASVSKRGWWMGFHVKDDRQWELVKKGGRTGFSIHGKGHRTERELDAL